MTTYSAVVTTGIYCRPGCGARPLARNARTFELAAAAEAAGFRACLRCRPYRVAGPVPLGAPELVCQAVQMIIYGALDDGGTEAGLAARTGVSARHLRRLFLQHLGATPDQLARSRRAHFARRLLDDTDLTALDVAFASGFGSLRQFNRTMREVFRASPTDLRRRRHRADRLVADGGLALRLPVLPGYDWAAVRAFLGARAVPGVEAVDGTSYRRTITVAGAAGLVEVEPGDPGNLLLRLHLPYWEGLIHLVGRIARLLGVEAEHAAGAAVLATDPVLGPLIRQRPGLVVPGMWNPFEAGVAAIARRGRDAGAAARWLESFAVGLGMPVPGLPDGLSHAFPEPGTVTPARLAAAGIEGADALAVAALAAIPAQAIDPSEAGPGGPGPSPGGLDRDLHEYLAFRLGRTEAFPLVDPTLRAALADVGLVLSGSGPGPWAEPWRPWLALAAAHLMAHGDTLSSLAPA
jgi:AraC family transcriptional regulator, regulatory protein of adaptative response / DNA-3-methyladenine glycosylase II